MIYGGPGVPTPDRPLTGPSWTPLKGPYTWTSAKAEVFVLCDGKISNGRCMSCFQIIPTSSGTHYTKVVMPEGT